MSECMRGTCCLAGTGWITGGGGDFVTAIVGATGYGSSGLVSRWCFLAMRPCLTTPASVFSFVKWECAYLVGSLEP